MRLIEAKDLLLQNLPDATLRAQSAEEWSGPSTLPRAIESYYEEVGPVDLEIWGYGNPWYVPALAQLWDLQAGYRYDPETKERFSDWKDNWLVVAYEGGDPYIFDTETETILHDMHGRGMWDPKPVFQDLGEMISVFAVLGAIRASAGQRFTDDQGINPKYIDEASVDLKRILGSERRATTTLERLGWM